jgi:hypothetical protein
VLLTVMALVHTHKGQLPDARALLYEETVDILLWRWEQLKVGGEKETSTLRQLLLAAGAVGSKIIFNCVHSAEPCMFSIPTRDA